MEMTPAEHHLRGARMARKLAEDYRRDAYYLTNDPKLQRKYLSEAARADERAAWYEQHARMMQ